MTLETEGWTVKSIQVREIQQEPEYLTLSPSEIRYIMVLMGDHSHGSLIRPNDWFSGEDVLRLRAKLSAAYAPEPAI